MANGFIVTKEDWDNMTPEMKSWMTFNAVQSMDERVKRLEGKGWLNSGCSLYLGVK